MGWKIIEKSSTDVSFSDSHLFLQGDNLKIMQDELGVFSNSIKLIYVDPPYNTGTDAKAFSYANKIGDDAWIEFMNSRLRTAYELLAEDGVVILTIDDEMMAELKLLCNQIFAKKNFIGCIPIIIKPGGRSNDSFIRVEHEYILLYAKDSEKVNINLWPESDKSLKQYKYEDEGGKYKLRDFMRTGGHSYPIDRPNSFYCIKFDNSTHSLQTSTTLRDYMESQSIEIYSDKVLKSFVEEIEKTFSEDNHTLVFPTDSNKNYRIWRQTKPSFHELVNQNEIKVQRRERKPISIRIKDYAKSGVLPRSMWVDSKYDASTYGTKLLKDLVGENEFSYPKSLHAVIDSLGLFLSKSNDQLVLDMFGGSGTTNHAIIEINKIHKRKHRCITLEMQDYIRHVAYDRNKMVMEIITPKKVENSLIERKRSKEVLETDTDFKEKLILAKLSEGDENLDEDSQSFTQWIRRN